MRVAALYDIHGNLPALEAVLQDVHRARVDQVVVGGDVVPGPMARETLECLGALDVPVQFIRGNCEVAVLAEMKGSDPGPLPEQVRETMRWTARQLQSDYEQVFAGWPRTLRLEIPPLGEVLFCHGTPRDENEIFTRLTSDQHLASILGDVTAPFMICGHTHMQFQRTIGGTCVVNAGSVGMPFGPPGADWLLLGPDVQLRHTSYDLARAADRIRSTDYPQAEEFATRYVLQPPLEDVMLQAYARVDVR